MKWAVTARLDRAWRPQMEKHTDAGYDDLGRLLIVMSTRGYLSTMKVVVAS